MIPEFTDGYFKINSTHGFLPIQEPLERLPIQYQTLQDILDDLKNFIRNTEQDNIASAVLLNLKNYLPVIQQETDIVLIAALYRSYCFVSSAYTLFPAHVHYVHTKEYGVARNVLPQNLAQPLLYLAEQLNVFPWLEYSFGYSLGNYVKIDPTQGFDYTNLKMANSFIGSQDETGFIMVHVDINQHSPKLIESCNQLLMDRHHHINPKFSLELIYQVLLKMNQSRKKMWDASRWEHYNDFRVFIMGIKGNDKIFPNGLIYEPETEPRYYRGQSGSQDTIIPFLDNFFRVCEYYPKNQLTSYLMDMRDYRPKPFRDLLEWISHHNIGLIEWIISFENTWIVLSKIYKEIYHFRNGHFQFVQKYIMSNTKYPIATGGTPIVSWLPNQIYATLDALKHVLDNVKDKTSVEYIKELEDYKIMSELIQKQSQLLQTQNYNADKVYEMNETYNKKDYSI
jgi:indoleamine 2,3-dioxygenase